MRGLLKLACVLKLPEFPGHSERGRCSMGFTFDVLKTKVKEEGKFTIEELSWILDKMKEMDRTLDSLKTTTEERLHRIERKDDDHIPGGI